MRSLLYGTSPDPDTEVVGPTGNPLLDMLAVVPMRLKELPDPGYLLPDWVVIKPRLTGICGSEAKMVFLDYASIHSPDRAGSFSDNPMKGLISFPHVMGHEVVADVVALGPEAEGLQVGDRVVLNPWLSCGPRGVEPVCRACAAGDLSQCWSFAVGPVAPAIHVGLCSDVPGGFGELMSVHDSMLFKVPDSITDEQAVLADPFAVSLHGITRNPPQPGSKVVVYGAGALGTCALAILKALFPDVEVMAVARFDAQRALAEKLGARTVAPEPRDELIATIAEWSGGVLLPADGLPMAFPGGVDVVYDTVGMAETLEVGARVLRARGTLVKLGMDGPARWEDTPVYFKEITFTGSNAFGFEDVDGERKHGIQHYLDLLESGRIDLTGMLTHTFRLDEWRAAFTTIATQGETGAIKVAIDQR